MPTSGVRLARTPDVDDIGAVNVRAWRGRFAGVIPAEVLEAFDPADLAIVWARAILHPPTPSYRLLVAVHDDVIVGYAAIGPSQDPDAEPTTGELVALEVDPDRVGEGHGSRLMAAAVDHARALGVESLVAWCALPDEARRAFLQSAGWGPDTAFRDMAVGQDPDGSPIVVREVRLVTDLTAADLSRTEPA
ncbi:MAG: GNAT family N-acetyltransferase [Actinobacteria bacterium]|jgi:GNAT superfamily N-acetyltransferase|nr:GNAT family N-acetyltransferase [Actinomycetota bacterium]